MEHHQQPAIDFITNNPGSTKNQIGEALSLKGLSLFNLLRWLERDGFITTEGKGDEKLYYVAAPSAESEALQPEPANDDAVEAVSEETRLEEETVSTTEEVATGSVDTTEAELMATEQPEQTEGAVAEFEEVAEAAQVTAPEDQQPPLSAKQWQAPAEQEAPAASEDAQVAEQTEKQAPPGYILHKSRDNCSYRFNGQTYGKGPLVRAIVTHYVSEYPHISLEGLKEAFPDSLLKRFGIFQEIETAKRIANGGPRYFYKEDQQIQLSDAVVVVCSQFTKENIQPFLQKAAELDYEITIE